jgi:CTP:molybdopterin cytidylyltransferase MocA
MAQVIAGVILAGGFGERWGGPKAWAKLPEGRTFLEAARDTLRGAGVSPVVATLPPGDSAPAPEQLSAVRLPAPDMEMFDSLRVGLERVLECGHWQRVVVLPVDHPLVRPRTVAALCAVEARASRPRYRGKHGHPVCFDRSLAEGLVSGELEGPTLREVLYAADVLSVDVADPGVVANCNSPEALDRALAGSEPDDRDR